MCDGLVGIICAVYFLGVKPICIQFPAVKFAHDQAGLENLLCCGATDVTGEAAKVTLSGRLSVFD